MKDMKLGLQVIPGRGQTMEVLVDISCTVDHLNSENKILILPNRIAAVIVSIF